MEDPAVARPVPKIFEPRVVPIQRRGLASSAAAAATPPPAQPPPASSVTSKNSPGSAKAAEDVSKLVSAMNGANIQGMFSEYDAYRAYQKGGRKGAKPATGVLDAARTKLAPIDLQAAFKGLAMIAGKNYTRTTPGAPFAAVGPFQGTQKALVGLKQKVVGATANGSTKKWWQIGKRKGGRRSVTRRQRQRQQQRSH
jgi:hypothetical protein